MTDQPRNNSCFFFGIMVLKGGKWTPYSKFDGDSFGSALISAEDLDKKHDFDAVKLMRIPAKGSGGVEQKEMWVSPRLRARSDVQASAKIRAGVKQTKENLAAQRKASVKK